MAPDNACLAHMGRPKEAVEVMKPRRAIAPVVIPTAEHWRIRERLAVGVAPEEVAGH
jgi:hypothetical protein